MRSIRDILAEMRWPQAIRESSAAHHTAESAMIFTHLELGEYPIKWLKYLLLSKVGLQSIEDIERQINRFQMRERPDAQDWCFENLTQSRANGNLSMIVIKIVPWNLAAQLKNYRVFQPEDVGPAFEKLKNEYGTTSYEIWCCQSSVDSNTLSLGGRITYPNSVLDQQIELVWFASPRWLESVSLPDFPYPYMRAIKPLGRMAFQPRVIHVPSASSYSNIDQSTLIADCDWVVEQIAQRREAIETLLDILYRFGAREVCFPFKVSNGKLTIIDWDTEIESTQGEMLDL